MKGESCDDERGRRHSHSKDQKGKTVAVALRGKVPVSVIGPVKKGDLIVTSDEPGVGQAHAGVTNCVYVIGKCLEDDDTENDEKKIGDDERLRPKGNTSYGYKSHIKISKIFQIRKPIGPAMK